MLNTAHLPKRVTTPTLLQMEPVECGAAALGIVLGSYGRIVPLVELRLASGVSRDGGKLANVRLAAQSYGLVITERFVGNLDGFAGVRCPAILFWNFNHFLVLEGFGRDRVFLNDPASGPRDVSYGEFTAAFTGTLLELEPGPGFKTGGRRVGWIGAMRERLRGSEKALLYVVLVSLALVLPGLVVPVFSQIFVDEFLTRGNRDWVKPLLVAMALTAVCRALLTWLQQHYLLRLETKLSIVSSSKFLSHVLRLPMVFFSQRFGGEIASRVAINDQVAQVFSGELATSILGMLTMVIYAAVMLQYNVMLTLLSLAIAALNMAVLWAVARRRDDANQHLLQEQGKLTGATMAGLQMIETLKGTGSETQFFAHWAEYQARALNAQQRLGASTGFLTVVPPVLMAVNNAVLLGAGGFLVMQGRLSLGMLVAFQSLAASFVEPVKKLVALGAALQTVDGGLKRLDDVLASPVDPESAPRSGTSKKGADLKLSGLLELRGLTFGYSRLDPPLVENFSLRVEPGGRVALVGATGCGKSTVSRLVCGFYEPWAGEVLFDGRARVEIPRAVLANSLALVDQEIFLFEGTIRENLTLWDSTAPEAAIVQAAKDACIHDDITRRPGGYDSPVEEAGRNFSGGQRQRLEIARALVNNPTLLVLDEGTSALDANTEKRIDENLRRRGCTCLIIAHRLSTIRDCDEIIVLERGKILQRGTHAGLLAVPGAYANLVQE